MGMNAAPVRILGGLVINRQVSFRFLRVATVSQESPNLQRRAKLPRRTILRGVGVSLALPLLQRDAEASTSATDGSSRPPQRMVCVANPLGFVPETFFPDEPGPLKNLPALLQPLAGLESEFSVFSNLDHGVTGGHQSVHTFLSGIRDSDSVEWESRNQSVDQRAAELVGGQTRYPSIVASVGKNTDELECRMSWTRTGVNIPPVSEALTLFNALFQADTPDQRRAKRKAFAEHASILDVIGQQAVALEKELGSIDRQKLDEYLTSVRSVEKRLRMSGDWIDRPKPSVPMKPPQPGQAFTQRLPLFYELIRLALMTDSTRVATLSVPGNLPVADLGLQGNYHAFSHHGKRAEMLKQLLTIEKFQTAQLAKFLQSLRDTPQPNGGTLLEHTMVLAGSGMGNASSHSNRKLPILVAGSRFATGQHYVFPETSSKRVPLCNLFTTMLETISGPELSGKEQKPFNKATGSLELPNA